MSKFQEELAAYKAAVSPFQQKRAEVYKLLQVGRLLRIDAVPGVLMVSKTPHPSVDGYPADMGRHFAFRDELDHSFDVVWSPDGSKCRAEVPDYYRQEDSFNPYEVDEMMGDPIRDDEWVLIHVASTDITPEEARAAAHRVQRALLRVPRDELNEKAWRLESTVYAQERAIVRARKLEDESDASRLQVEKLEAQLQHTWAEIKELRTRADEIHREMNRAYPKGKVATN